MTKVEIATVALIASMTKKIKQMIFMYLTDILLEPETIDNMPLKDYIVFIFNDLIARIKRKAVYICDSDMDIGKAQFCLYFTKFSKNKKIKGRVDFIESKLSELLNFEP